MNLRHPCISGVIGVMLPTELKVLKIIGIDFGDNSLSRIVSTSPLWWTPTAKAKAIAGLVLGLHFAHSFGFLHGHLTGHTLFFNENGVIQITDFGLNGFGELEGQEGGKKDIGGFSGENWTPTVDMRAFTRILSEILIGASAEQGCDSSDIPSFVFEIIGNGESADLKAIKSLSDILKILKLHNFQIIEGVDIEEVWHFVKWIEKSETLIE
jgi:serine/threonine protein kinase